QWVPGRGLDRGRRQQHDRGGDLQQRRERRDLAQQQWVPGRGLDRGRRQQHDRGGDLQQRRERRDLARQRPATDQLTLTGNYNGAAGSVLALDVNLGTRQADLLRINGSNNGQTTLVLNRLDNPNAALFSSTPVPIVVSGGGAGQVTLSQPIQGSGFATFELEQTGGGSFQIVSRLNVNAASGAAGSISALITSLNVGFFQSVSAFIGAPSGNNNDDKTASVSVSSDPKMSWAALNKAAAAQTEVAPAPGIRPNTISSGMWARGSGGEFIVRGTSTAVFGPTRVGAATKVDNSFAGMQVGIDTGVFNIDNSGWNLHLGITGGSVFADGTQKIGAQTTGVFDVPFIGVYGALTNGPFFSDLNYRHDFFNARISNQLAGLNGANLQIESNSVSGSSGYRFDFEGLFGTELPYFIEPSGSMSYTNTSVGSLPVIGGTLLFRDIDSILGRFGLRFGTAFQATENLALQPFITGSVWHEFAGNTVSRFVSANIAVDPNAFVPIITDRVGTFGQVGVGISAQLLDTPLLGYVRSDFRFGDKLEGYAVNGGIRYQF
ncbi:autotransporter outer membrane beta-barrel domain-containing protein, partial [Micromonospora sp. STR1s_5]|nr:autotransporter outer membrane beta-barrel domain-containing protein [Micromonospora sp. STR1s_5]